MHVPEEGEKSPQKVQKIINPLISKYLQQLIHPNENVRIQNGVNLVLYLHQGSANNQSDREHKYVLKRLIRGAGGSSNASKCGFYTALVGYFNAFKEKLTVDEIFEVLDSELKVSKKATTKENADAYIGHVLVISALQKCGMLTKKSKAVKALEYVLAASQQKIYHYKLSYNCLINFLASQSEEEFRKTLFPFMRDHLSTPWDEQTMHSLHFLIEARTRFPSLIDESFLENFLGSPQILSTERFEKIFDLFWKDKPETEIMQPAYDCLGKFVVSSKNFPKFWTYIVDKTVEHLTRGKEVITVKLATDVVSSENLGKSFGKIFSEKFLQMVFHSLRQQGHKDEVLKATYLEFFDAVFEALKKREDKQVNILKKFVMHPGTLLIDKYQFSNKILHKTLNIMKEESLKEFAEFLKNILIDKEQKSVDDSQEKWLNSEKLVAMQLLQRIISSRLLANDMEWKLSQAKFILTISIFYSDNGETALKKPEILVVPIELADHMMNLFFHGLEGSFSNLESGKMILYGLAYHCNTMLEKKSPQKYIRRDFSEKSLKVWQEMFTTVEDLNKSGEKYLVFQVFLLSMGLQLFRDAELAEESIRELQSCLLRARKKKTKLSKSLDSEPEWIEVLMDLILHLLSQGSSILRNIIKKVFPSLCPQLNHSAVFQILSLLDMKDGQNPLKYENEEDSGEESGAEDKEPKINGNKEEDSEDDSESDSDQDDEEEEVDEDEDEGTISDKLRSAVSAALGFRATESDQESVNLDDMTEEEGQKLDEALSSAFKVLKESKPQRKTKKDQQEDTTLVHFRNRLIDLLIIYMKHNPELSVTLEIMITLYDMIPFCTNEESKPLLGKIEEALRTLVLVRNFRNSEDQLSECENLMKALTKLCRRNENPQSMEVRNNFIVKGVKFIIYACNKISAPADQIEKMLGDFVTEFINSRNPTLNYNFFSNIFILSWSGLWHLAERIIKSGLTSNTRIFRRIQSFDLLTILYKNHRLIQADVQKASEIVAKIERSVLEFLEEISSGTVSINEFKSMSLFLWEVYRCHRQIPSLEAQIKWKEVEQRLQEIRLRLQLDAAAMNAYTKLCNVLGIKIVKNSAIQKPQQQVNGVQQDVEMRENGKEGDNGPTKAKKRKMKQHQQEKKNKKLARMQASADGLGDGISFAEKIQYPIDNSDEE